MRSAARAILHPSDTAWAVMYTSNTFVPSFSRPLCMDGFDLANRGRQCLSMAMFTVCGILPASRSILACSRTVSSNRLYMSFFDALCMIWRNHSATGRRRPLPPPSPLPVVVPTHDATDMRDTPARAMTAYRYLGPYRALWCTDVASQAIMHTRSRIRPYISGIESRSRRRRLFLLNTSRAVGRTIIVLFRSIGIKGVSGPT